MQNIAIKKTLSMGYEAAQKKVPEVLKAQGFGVLTHIDMTAALKEKIGVDFRRYEVFGACNPPLAHQALQANLDVGVLLPCNVVLYEDDDGNAAISAMDPAVLMGGDAPKGLKEVATTARAKLVAALEELD